MTSQKSRSRNKAGLPVRCCGSCCFAFRGRLYIFDNGSIVADAAVQSYPLDPAADHRSNTPHPLAARTVLPIPYPFASNQRELGTLGNIHSMRFRAPHVFAPYFGVFAVTYRSFRWEDRETAFIHFWPAHEEDSILNIGQGHFYESEGPINRTAVGASGTFVLLLAHPRPDADSEDRYGYLGLLHFSSTQTPHTTFRKLEIGNLFTLSCAQIALDDSLGLVLAVDDVGKMTAMWYG